MWIKVDFGGHYGMQLVNTDSVERISKDAIWFRGCDVIHYKTIHACEHSLVAEIEALSST